MPKKERKLIWFQSHLENIKKHINTIKNKRISIIRYILKGKGKNNKKARYNQARRSASAEEKPVVAVETASEEQTEKGE